MTLPKTTYFLRFVHRDGSEIEEFEHPDEPAARRHMDLFGKEDGDLYSRIDLIEDDWETQEEHHLATLNLPESF